MNSADIACHNSWILKTWEKEVGVDGEFVKWNIETMFFGLRFLVFSRVSMRWPVGEGVMELVDMRIFVEATYGNQELNSEEVLFGSLSDVSTERALSC